MPASEVMKLYREKKLHSGPGGPVVKSKKQATAIQISMARKEGHDIPYPSKQQGGPVPASGDYQLHEGELVGSMTPPIDTTEAGPAKPKEGFGFRGPSPRGNPTLDAERAAVNAPLHRVNVDAMHTGGTVPRTGVYRMQEGEYVVPASLASRYKDYVGSRQQGGGIPATGDYQLHRGELVPQAEDIARRTREAEAADWHAAIKRSAGEAPYQNIMSGPDPRDPKYAVQGLAGNVAERMRQQAEEASRPYQRSTLYGSPGGVLSARR